jgi:hypothetical protein
LAHARPDAPHPIDNLADVEPVLEEMGKWPHAKANTAALAAVAAAIDLGPDAPPVELRNQSAHGAELEIEAEDGADRLCLLGHDFEFLVETVIAERHGFRDLKVSTRNSRIWLVLNRTKDELRITIRKPKTKM